MASPNPLTVSDTTTGPMETVMLKASWKTARALTGLMAMVGLAAVAARTDPSTSPDATRVGVARAHQNVDALLTTPTPVAHPEAQGLQEAVAFQASGPSSHPEAQGLQEAHVLRAMFDLPSPTVRRNF